MRTGTTAPLVVAAAVGLAVGAGAYAFAYAKGASYAGNDPATCANCHVMAGHLDAWRKSSHHAAATCNDCHAGVGVAKVAAKASNGWRHSTAFTLGGFPDVPHARPSTRDAVDAQCRRCHAGLVAAMTAGGETSCVRCHDSVGHLH